MGCGPATPRQHAAHAHPARFKAPPRPRPHEGADRGGEPRHGLRTGNDDHDAQYHPDAGKHAERLLSAEPPGRCVCLAQTRPTRAGGPHRGVARCGRRGGARGGGCQPGPCGSDRAGLRAFGLPAGGSAADAESGLHPPGSAAAARRAATCRGERILRGGEQAAPRRQPGGGDQRPSRHAHHLRHRSLTGVCV